MEILSPGRVRLTVDEAQNLSEDVLCRAGYDAEEARIIANHVMDAALCGYEYSGLPKILNVIEYPALRQPRSRMRVIRETPNSVLYDGGNNSGMVTMYHAAQKVIAMARGQGMAMVGINNSWMSGRSAYYVDLVARAGLVALHTVSSRAHVAAPGSMGPVTGTNPVAFGFPTLSDPFVIDLGTSAFMGTDLQLRERMGTPLPEGVAMDAEGKITTDPLKVATILPFGGYKGFALSMAMQALGVLAGSGFGDDKIYGYFIMAIDPERMLPAGDFRQHMSDMLATVKAAPRQPGVDEIRLPGERSVRERARLVKAGLEIDRQIYDALLAVPRGTLPPLS